MRRPLQPRPPAAQPPQNRQLQRPQPNRTTNDDVGLPALKPQLIQTETALDALVQRLMACTDSSLPVAFDTETTDLNPFRAELVGIGICWGEALDALAYIPLGHKGSEDSSPEQLPLETVLTALAPWLASSNHPKALQNAKYDRLILLRHGVALEGVVIDTLLADYLRDAAAKHGLELMAEREFGFQPTAFTDLVGKKQTFADVPLEPASLYCGMDVHVTHRLALLLRRQLEAMGPQLLPLLEQVEQPLEPVLARMESTGIRIDVPYLQGLSEEMGSTLQQLESDAKAAAGVDFNLASPKQLGELLFDTLGLDRKKSRRTKTGFSTDATVLEKLGNDHPVVPLVLEHRVLSKLKSTYIDALPQLVEAETGRVHTDFNQAVTATGRLSSSNPNLQNIPVRTEYSRRIRKAFLPQEGWTLLSADYSQIELRILTHLSGEEVLQEAYRSGDDVHALTARLLLDKDEVSPDERRLGKTINFGVIYGMGAQRFARETGVSQRSQGVPGQVQAAPPCWRRCSPSSSCRSGSPSAAVTWKSTAASAAVPRSWCEVDNGLGRAAGQGPPGDRPAWPGWRRIIRTWMWPAAVACAATGRLPMPRFRARVPTSSKWRWCSSKTPCSVSLLPAQLLGLKPFPSRSAAVHANWCSRWREDALDAIRAGGARTWNRPCAGQ